ncbi:hypothetical protein [Luteimonas terrae]|uniref:Uncharacterized protein n=1 Tax=Luteimonas terrae TaxID=1530191 RepID=A0ABU1XVM2_9GAMM|nr:hypothetical protein [Luteimonas terrae]MDR7192810.1 hypothetical protein [Luteimonas terrae]
MRTHLLILLLSCLLAAIAPLQAQGADNPELAALYRDDQQARADAANIDWSVVFREDAARRARVLALMREGAMRTAADHHHAAMVFQHGANLEDIRIAHALSTLASTLAPDEISYRWLITASWDRIMTTQLQPQWYGTQFHGSDDGLFLYPVADGAVDDAERARMGVPSLAEAQANVAQMAASMGAPVRAKPPTMEQLRAERRAAGATTP